MIILLFQLVCENVVIGCRILLKGEYGNLLPSMVACHVIYELNGFRFKTFSSIVCVWPKCCKRILQVQETKQNNLVTTEEIVSLIDLNLFSWFLFEFLLTLYNTNMF